LVSTATRAPWEGKGSPVWLGLHRTFHSTVSFLLDPFPEVQPSFLLTLLLWILCSMGSFSSSTCGGWGWDPNPDLSSTSSSPPPSFPFLHHSLLFAPICLPKPFSTLFHYKKSWWEPHKWTLQLTSRLKPGVWKALL
jgi:hypothetical protein